MGRTLIYRRKQRTARELPSYSRQDLSGASRLTPPSPVYPMEQAMDHSQQTGITSGHFNTRLYSNNLSLRSQRFLMNINLPYSNRILSRQWHFFLAKGHRYEPKRPSFLKGALFSIGRALSKFKRHFFQVQGQCFQ